MEWRPRALISDGSWCSMKQTPSALPICAPTAARTPTRRSARPSSRVCGPEPRGCPTRKDNQRAEPVGGVAKPADLAAELAEGRRLLRIDPAQRNFRVTYGAARGAPDEITIETLSIFRALTELAAYVQVPEVHLAAGRAPPLLGDVTQEQPRFNVRSGCERPKDCFAAVCYRGYSFWIDDTDFQSKRTMAYLI